MKDDIAGIQVQSTLMCGKSFLITTKVAESQALVIMKSGIIRIDFNRPLINTKSLFIALKIAKNISLTVIGGSKTGFELKSAFIKIQGFLPAVKFPKSIAFTFVGNSTFIVYLQHTIVSRKRLLVAFEDIQHFAFIAPGVCVVRQASNSFFVCPQCLFVSIPPCSIKKVFVYFSLYERSKFKININGP